MEEVKMPIYRVPVKERFAFVGQASFDNQSELIFFGDYGVMVYSSRPVIVSQRILRKCLFGERNVAFHISCDNPGKLFEKFIAEFPETALGVHPAFRINSKGVIVEYPFCEHLNHNFEGDYICGELEDPIDGNGTHGMCFMSGYDPPDNCRVWLSLVNFEDLIKLGLARVEEINGIKFIRPN